MSKESITLLFVLENESINKQQKTYYKQLVGEFSDVIGIVKKGADAQWIETELSDILDYSFEEGKVSALNRSVKKAQTSFCMILESDEFCALSKFPEKIAPNTCYRALIDVAGKEEPQRNYQVRLFPSNHFEQSLFDGFAIPDINQSFHEAGWVMAEEVIPIHKTSVLFKAVDAEAEADKDKPQVMSLFWQAVIESENQNYDSAEQKFRKVLRNESLFEFDCLAALNGLANALAEQHKLEEAYGVAKKSLQVNSRQRAPYLSLYKVSRMSGRPEEAYSYLNEYLSVMRYASRANLDVSLPLSECHFLMADTTFKQGDYKRAFRHYECFYELNDRKVSLEILEKLFIYAIELKNYEKSVQYFTDIFGSYIPDNLNEEMSARLLESLALFMDNEWYGFVSNIYEQLVEHNPEDNKLLNSWISTLIKNKEINKAREVISRKKTG